MDNNQSYTFTLEKIFEYEKKKSTNIYTKGDFNLTITNNLKTNSSEYVFRYENFFQKGSKEPLVFTPFKWEFNPDVNQVSIKSKKNLEAIWKKYRNKYNRPETQAYFLTLERLLFNTQTGLEHYSLSYCIYLPFFIQQLSKLKKDEIIQGLDWIFIPMDIPVNSYFKCIHSTNRFIVLEGWITLDKNKLDDLLRQEKFYKKARDYHFSQDFSIDSEIKITLTSSDLQIKSCFFQLEITGKNLKETMKYEIKRKEKRDPYTVTKFKIIDPY